MKIIIPGGSGQVGTLLARAFHAEGHEMVVLARHPPGARPHRPRMPLRLKAEIRKLKAEHSGFLISAF
jgi:uncharacterized protein YbjT (DUF2867 family)